MLKNWKSLFVKTEGEEQDNKRSSSQPLTFPVNSNAGSHSQSSAANYTAEPNNPAVNEVLKVYENGLDSINMPGYDFYEFYQAITGTGNTTEQAYNMAYHMARTLDKTITPQKLMQDAEFYISKINEVHSQYVSQGQQKLGAIQERKNEEKSRLTSEIDNASMRVSQLRAELSQLETDINNKRSILSKIEDTYYPQEKVIREKLNANDMAQRASIDKLNIIKDGIQRYLKN